MPEPILFIQRKKEYQEMLKEASIRVAKWPKWKQEAMRREVLNINPGKRNEIPT